MRYIIQDVLDAYDMEVDDLLVPNTRTAIVKTIIVHVAVKTTSYDNKEMAIALGISTQRISQLRQDDARMSYRDKRIRTALICKAKKQCFDYVVTEAILKANIVIPTNKQQDLIRELSKRLE